MVRLLVYSVMRGLFCEVYLLFFVWRIDCLMFFLILFVKVIYVNEFFFFFEWDISLYLENNNFCFCIFFEKFKILKFCVS